MVQEKTGGPRGEVEDGGGPRYRGTPGNATERPASAKAGTGATKGIVGRTAMLAAGSGVVAPGSGAWPGVTRRSQQERGSFSIATGIIASPDTRQTNRACAASGKELTARSVVRKIAQNRRIALYYFILSGRGNSFRAISRSSTARRRSAGSASSGRSCVRLRAGGRRCRRRAGPSR